MFINSSKLFINIIGIFPVENKNPLIEMILHTFLKYCSLCANKVGLHLRRMGDPGNEVAAKPLTSGLNDPNDSEINVRK